MSSSFIKLKPAWVATAILVAMFAFPRLSFPYELIIPDEKEKLMESMSLVMNGRYTEGEEIIRRYIEKYPDRPEGYFFMAGRYAEYMNASNDSSQMENFQKYANLTIKFSQQWILSHKNDPLGYFYLGNINGYLGLVDAQSQNLISAFRKSHAIKENLEKALELAPDMYDCYFGLGTLYYFASKKHMEEGGITGWIIKKFLTKGKDLRREGIQMLETAVAKHGITYDMAYSTLMWVMMSEGNYDRAYEMAGKVVERFPTDIHGYWAIGRIDLMRGMYQKGLKNFAYIAEVLKERKLPEDSFPEALAGASLSRIGVNISMKNTIGVMGEIKKLRRELKNDLMVRIEYQNRKRVISDWQEQLAGLEKRLHEIGPFIIEEE